MPNAFTNEAKEEKAARVLEVAKAGQPRWYLEKVVYGYLTTRISELQRKSIESEFAKVNGKERYAKTFSEIGTAARADGLKVNNDIAWFSIYSENPLAKKKERLSKNFGNETKSVEISYKEYFTLQIPQGNTERALGTIERLQRSLPSIAHDLASLAESENDQIKMKVPGNLQTFITHPDSIVIHYRDQGLSRKIRELVNTKLQEAGLSSFRDNRTESGFDMDSKDELYSGSHSSLMASVVADRVIQNIKQNPHLADASVQNFIEFLDRTCSEYAKFTPKEMLAKLDTVQE